MNTSRMIRSTALAATLLCAAAPAASRVIAAPVQATVTGVTLHLESTSSKINPKNTSLRQVRSGQAVRVIMYANLTGLTAPISASVTLTISGGSAVFSSHGDFTIRRSDLGGGTRGTRWFWNTVPACGAKVANCLPRKSGSYTARGTLNINGKQYSQSVALHVVGG